MPAPGAYPPTNTPATGTAQSTGAEGGGPNAQYATQTNQALNNLPGSVGADIAAWLASQIQGQQAQNTWTQQQLSVGEADILGQEAFQKRETGQQYGYQQQQFGVQQAGLGLSGQQLQQQLGHLGAGYGFQQQQNVLSGQNIKQNISDILAGYGFQQKGFGIQQGQLNLANTQARQQLGAAGSYGSGGARSQMQQQQSLQQQGLNLSEAQAAQQEKSALFGQRQAQKQLGLTEAEQKEQYGYSTTQVQDGMKQLQLQQRNLGISEAQANTMYQNALQQIGLSSTMSVEQLKTQLAGIAGGGWSPISSFTGTLAGLLPFLAGGLVSQGGQ